MLGFPFREVEQGFLVVMQTMTGSELLQLLPGLLLASFRNPPGDGAKQFTKKKFLILLLPTSP